jgi:hypothetical protein
LSKTWNVAKLTSEISSSLRKISCVCCGGVFAFAWLITAHAPLAIENDTPAKLKAGKVLLRRLLLVFGERFDMAQSSQGFGHIEPIDTATLRSQYAGASVKKVRKLYVSSGLTRASSATQLL